MKSSLLPFAEVQAAFSSTLLVRVNPMNRPKRMSIAVSARTPRR
jgi:hypothetical protein